MRIKIYSTSIAFIGILCLNASLQAQLFSGDAILLALQNQHTVALDTVIARQIETALARARTVHDTLKDIHAWPRYVPNQLLVGYDPRVEAWKSGALKTGFQPIDSLCALYGLDSVQARIVYVLHFSSPLRMDLLAEEFKKYIYVTEPNRILGDGNRIDALRKDFSWLFAFSLGWGDCPAGCAYRHYWYVEVQDSSPAHLFDELPHPYNKIKIHTWNVPARYPATVFLSAADLLAAMRSPDWWVRRHAVVVAGRLAEKSDPWLGEELSRKDLFQELKNDVLRRKREVISSLLSLLHDPDEDVANSARLALWQLTGKTLAQMYYPLRVGNEWEFESFPGQRTTETIEDSVADGTTVRYRFNRFREYARALLHHLDDSLMVKAGTHEFRWVNFGAAIGQQWEFPFDTSGISGKWKVTLQSTDDVVTVPAGTFSNVYRFHFKCPGADCDWVEYYAPFIGPIKRTLLGFAVIDYDLVRFRVNDSTQTGIESPRVPEPSVEILAPHPNPSRLVVDIPFVVRHRESSVRLSVHDILGREVAVVENTVFKPGQHAAHFDTGLLSQGIYIVRLLSSDSHKMRTVAVIR